MPRQEPHEAPRHGPGRVPGAEGLTPLGVEGGDRLGLRHLHAREMGRAQAQSAAQGAIFGCAADLRPGEGPSLLHHPPRICGDGLRGGAARGDLVPTRGGDGEVGAERGVIRGGFGHQGEVQTEVPRQQPPRTVGRGLSV